MRAVSSGGEHYLDTVGVTSSNLVPPTIPSSAVGCCCNGSFQENESCEPESITVRCSTLCGHGSAGRAPPCQGGGRGFEPRCPLHRLQEPAHRSPMGRLFFQAGYAIGRRGQVVRQRPAKPLSPVRIRTSPPTSSSTVHIFLRAVHAQATSPVRPFTEQWAVAFRGIARLSCSL